MFKYPAGEEMSYASRTYSDGYIVDASPSCSEEARERERLKADVYNTIRKAAEVHRCENCAAMTPVTVRQQRCPGSEVSCPG